MSRPQRCRKICSEPVVTGFSPDDTAVKESVVLTMDEFEAIRLVDLEKLTHEQCAEQMEISRSTVTEIYESAREKIAYSLVNGIRLEIDGGNYRLCDGNSKWCRKKHCERFGNNTSQNVFLEGAKIMRIAVTYKDKEIFQHFGHTEQFKFYDIENGKVVSSYVINTDGSGHGALAGFLAANKIDVLICGGIGGGAKTALAEAEIKLFGGVSGSADEAVGAFLNNTLEFNPNVRCSHHGEGHICGDHGCH